MNSSKETKISDTLSAILLISGTCIGAGMLALPIVTGLSGFYPAMLVSTICWLFMLATGLLLLEATLWMEEETNILSMCKRFFGSMGKWIGGVSFLFLYYCLLVAYVAGGTPVFLDFLMQSMNIKLSPDVGYALFGLIFGLIVYMGANVVARVNWILMIGLITSFVLLIVVGSTEVSTEFLKRVDWKLSLFALPTLFSAYGYHNVIPTISTFLKRNAAKLRIAIIVGTTIPFVAYSLWQWMIIGSISLEGINLAAKNGEPISLTLQRITGHPLVSIMGALFGFFALVTSLLGVGLSVVDFLADGLKVKKQGLVNICLTVAAFLPPTIFAAKNPGIFIQAIGIAGGFGEAILNGLIPIGMVWVGRYKMGLKSDHELPGGRVMLGMLLAFTLFIMCLEIYIL
jgi:tyrosine-specific transport protein